MLRPRPLAAAVLAAALLSCASSPPQPPPIASSRVENEQPFFNWGAHPFEIEKRLSAEPFEIVAVEAAGGGVTGANRATLKFADGESMEVKWKTFPPELDHWNNSPRKEIAAYRIQKWFLTPEQYVVPTSVVRCIAIDQVRKWKADVQPTVADTDCILVVLTVWLRHVTAPKDAYDAERFRSDAAYAVHLANLNVLTHLIDHRDGRQGNLLFADESGPPRVYAADNGISFEPWVWNYFVTNWNELRVPAVPTQAIERLQRVSKREFEELRVLVELELDEAKIYRPAAKPHAPIDADEGVRRRGSVLQLGLTDSEITGTRERLDELLKAVARDEVPAF